MVKVFVVQGLPRSEMDEKMPRCAEHAIEPETIPTADHEQHEICYGSIRFIVSSFFCVLRNVAIGASVDQYRHSAPVLVATKMEDENIMRCRFDGRRILPCFWLQDLE